MGSVVLITLLIITQTSYLLIGTTAHEIYAMQPNILFIFQWASGILYLKQVGMDWADLVSLTVNKK